MSGEGSDPALVLTSATTKSEKHKKKKLPTLSVSIRSLKKFSVSIIVNITPAVIAIVL